MLTELQKQINSQLRSNELGFLAHKSSKLKIGKKGKVSFLFDTNTEFYNKSVVTHKTSIPLYEDISQLRYLSEQGLIELESLNPEMSQEHFSDLFKSNEPVSVQFMSQHEAEEMLEKIKKFVDYLVPYFLMDSAKICIEYMIQTYDIHVLLGEYLFYSFLPYHDMAEFSILVQILEITEESEIVGLVESIKKTKSVISSRNQLSLYLIRNQSLFNNIVGFWEKKIEDYNSTKNTVLVNLINWLSIEIINELIKGKTHINSIENCIKNIIDVILLNICIKNSKFEELRCTGYCILYKLSTPLIKLSREIQERIIYELFNSLIFNQKSGGISEYLPEILFIMNNFILKFKSITYFRFLGSEISKFVLENGNLFTTAIKQLLAWNLNILQIFNLIINSIFNFGLVLDPIKYSESCIMFIQNLLNDLHNQDLPLTLEESYSKLIKVITLVLFDISNQENDHVNKMIHYLYDSYSSEFISALSFSLRVSTGNERIRIESFISKIIKSRDLMIDQSNSDLKETGDSTRMFISLLNSEESEVMDSCINVVRNTILKFEKDIKSMGNFEREIFDISIKHYFDFKNKNVVIFENHITELLALNGTLFIAKYLDEESESRVQYDEGAWRILFILKNIFFYLKYRLNSVSSLDYFLSQERNTFEGKDIIGNMITNNLFQVFGKKFRENFVIVIETIFELLDILGKRKESSNKEDEIKTFIYDNSDFYIPFFALLTQLKIVLENPKLKDLIVKIVYVLYKKEEVKIYCEYLLKCNKFNYLELLFIISSLENCFEAGKCEKNVIKYEFNLFTLTNTQKIIVPSFSKNNDMILGLIERLYYKLYSGIHTGYMDLSRKKNTSSSESTTITNGTLILKVLRSFLNESGLLNIDSKMIDQRLLNIILLDTFELISNGLNERNANIPSFSLIQGCFKPKYDILKIKSIILGLSLNLMNIMSYCKKYQIENGLSLENPINYENENKLSLFYGKNCYIDILISHSYSLLEIIISKFPINDEFDTVNLKHFTEMIYKTLVYSVIPGLCRKSDFSNSIKMASIRLCKSIKDKILEINDKSYMENEDIFKSLLVFDSNTEKQDVFRSCYLMEKAPNLNQVLELMEIVIRDQSKFIIKSESNFLNDLSVDICNSENKDFSIVEWISKLNLVILMEQFSTDENKIDSENVIDYIENSLIYYNNSTKYHTFLLKLANLLRKKIEINDCSKNKMKILLAFIKQGIESLKNNYMDINMKKIVNKYISEFKMLNNYFKDGSDLLHIIKTDNSAKRILDDVFLSIMDKDLLKFLEGDEIVSFISYIIILMSEYSSNKINKDISLISILDINNLNLLDSLVIQIFKYLNANNNFGQNKDDKKILKYMKSKSIEKNLLSWLYDQVYNLNIFLTNHNKENINMELIRDVFKYIDNILQNISHISENSDFSVLVKLIVYSIGILEYGLKDRRNLKYSDIEFLINYMRNNIGIDNNNGKEKILLNPMIIVSTTSLFTNIKFISENGKEMQDKGDYYYKNYFNLYKSLFIIYRNFVTNITRLNNSLSETNYSIKMTFYSLSLFVEHSLNKCIYFDEYIISRMKNILFNILTFNQIREITIDSLKLNKFEEMIIFMEKLYNDVIYSTKVKEGLLTRNNCLYIIIRSFIGRLPNINNEKVDTLMNYVLENKLFETRTDFYSMLLDKILSEMEIMICYNEEIEHSNKNSDLLHINGFKPELNIFFTSKCLIHFLSKTLFEMEINEKDCLYLVELLNKLIFMKTIIDKKTLKEFRNISNKNNTNTECGTMEETTFKFKAKLKSKVDRLEVDLLYKMNDGFILESSSEIEMDYNLMQDEIDELIKSIIENDIVKKYIILYWDISKKIGFDNANLFLNNNKFMNTLLNNQLEYFGLVLNETLNRNLKLEFDENNTLEEMIIFRTIIYLLNDRVEYKEEISKTCVKIWIKKWYIIETILKVMNRYHNIRKELVIKIFSEIIKLYKYYENKENYYCGIIFKIPVIHNFLLTILINELDDQKISILVLNEIDIIINDILKTIDLLSNNSHDLNDLFLSDRKVVSILVTKINRANSINFDKNDETHDNIKTILTLPFISLIYSILNSKVGILVINTGDLGKKLVRMIFLNNLLSYLNINKLTKLIKNQDITNKSNNNSLLFIDKNEHSNRKDNLFKENNRIIDNNNDLRFKLYLKEIDKSIFNEKTLESVVENNLMKLLLIYCNISYSTSTSNIASNKDFIGDYSDMIQNITSNIFKAIGSSFNNMDTKLINKEYSRLSLLVLIISFTLNFSKGTSILENKIFIEKMSHLYLLLINFLIINFMKLYSSKNNKDTTTSNIEKTNNISNKRKKKSDNDFIENKLASESTLFEFVSTLLGNNILTSHCMLNENWIRMDYKEKYNSNETDFSYIREKNGKCNNIQVWELESSIMTLLSVFTVKLSSKKLREFVLLIKKLVHRNGDSFISKINNLSSNKSKQIDNTKHDKLNEKMLIKEAYDKLYHDSNLDIVKDIYSCRIWMLVLLTIIDQTGDYGVHCLIEDVITDIKLVSDLTQINALTCIQNNTLIQYSNENGSNKKHFNYQQISNLNHTKNDCGWYWYHLGVYNLMLIGMIYKSLSAQNNYNKEIPNCIENSLIHPVITNLDMFALFDHCTYSSVLGSGKQWNIIINDIWLNVINSFRNNDLILANILRSLINKIRNGNKHVRVFSSEILFLLWKDEVCSICILPYISELLPIIKELLSDSSEELNRIAKSIVKKIQERTGEDISKQL